jgi:Tol biopolymer transport system component
MYPRYSPDGRRIAVTINDLEGAHIWVANLTTGALTRITSTGSNQFPQWTPDGERIVFYSDRADGPGAYWTAADGTGSPELLVAGYDHQPHGWSPDGRRLTYSVIEPAGNHLWSLDPTRETEPEPLGSGCCADVSPDGKWLAYVDSSGGEAHVFVRELGGAGRRHQVSSRSGDRPLWAPDGRTIYYQTEEGEMMQVPVSTQPLFASRAPKLLLGSSYLESSYLGGTYATQPNFDIAPDGQSFVMVKGDDIAFEATEVRVILDWFDELRRLSPVD